MELYHNNEILQKNVWIDSNEIINLEFIWNYKNNIYYTLIIYDIDTPSTFVHLLVTNIPKNDIEYGTIILDYMKLNPPSNTHRYIITVFEQTGLITDLKFNKRDKFSLLNFIQKNNLHLIDEKMFVSSRNEFYLDPPNNYLPNHSKNSIIKQNSDLNDKDKKYCSCVIDVAEKNTNRCNLGKDWGNMSGGKMCYSPYAVCAKSVGTTNKKCGLNYDYDAMTKEQLVSFLNLNHINADTSLSKDELLKMIQNKKL